MLLSCSAKWRPSLAEKWFSPELMSALRSENLRLDLTQKRSEVVCQVKAQVMGYLRSGSFNSCSNENRAELAPVMSSAARNGRHFNSRRLADIVNYIRQNSDFSANGINRSSRSTSPRAKKPRLPRPSSVTRRKSPATSAECFSNI